MTYGYGYASGYLFNSWSSGEVVSPAVAMLADYDDGMAIDWLSGTLANKQSGALTYDGDIASFPSTTVTGSLAPTVDDDVLVNSSNSLIVATSGISLTSGRGTLIQTLKGGFGNYNPFWISDANPLDTGDSISLIRFGTQARLRIADSDGGSAGSAIPAGDMSNTATTHKVGSTWLSGTGCRCTVNGAGTSFDASVSFVFAQTYMGFGGVSGVGANLVQTLWLPTYSDEATLASLTS
jgi:hypothetical protein